MNLLTSSRKKIEDFFKIDLNASFMIKFSIASRTLVLFILLIFSFWPEYINLKIGYNNARLVELSSGIAMRLFYEISDWFLSLFGDPVKVMQTNGGMTWSIRVFGLPFTDPIAALSVLVKAHKASLGFFLGLSIPLTLAFLFGRVFCNYICPASLFFYSISRIRQALQKYFYLPNLKLNRGVAWGVLLGGLLVAYFYSHSVWIFILPYFSIGQSIFNGFAYGILSAGLISIALFGFADLLFGNNFSCRYLCPTGRILGVLGKKAYISVRRDASKCLDKCTSCIDVCPMHINPKIDETQDCTLCNHCILLCPTQCLSMGTKLTIKGMQNAN